MFVCVCCVVRVCVCVCSCVCVFAGCVCLSMCVFDGVGACLLVCCCLCVRLLVWLCGVLVGLLLVFVCPPIVCNIACLDGWVSVCLLG